MDVELVANGNVTLVLIPKTPMEEEALKLLAKQENEIIQIRSGAAILSRTVNQGIIIRKRQETPIITEEDKNGPDETETEDLQ